MYSEHTCATCKYEFFVTQPTNQPTIISRHNISLILCILSHATVRISDTGRDLAAASPCISYALIFFSHTIFSYIVTRFLLHASYSVTLRTVFHTTHVLSVTCTHTVTRVGLQGMEKIMETVVRDTHFFINTELGHHLPVIQLLSFLP
jgi:hypothetical protein